MNGFKIRKWQIYVYSNTLHDFRPYGTPIECDERDARWKASTLKQQLKKPVKLCEVIETINEVHIYFPTGWKAPEEP